MPPKGVSQNSAGEKGNHTVIRPLAYVAEAELARWAEIQGFPIIPCTLCGSQDNLQRQQMRQLVADWQTQHPGRIASMVTALKHVMPSHLMDPRAFDFKGLEASALPVVALD